MPQAPPQSAGRQRGIVLVLTLLGLLLLAGLVMWVMNLGQQVNNRIVAQGAADTAVQGGAGWIARQLNTVAGNNVDMARYVAVINVLDSFPQAAEYALREVKSFEEALSNQLAAGINASPPALDSAATYYFQQLLDGVQENVDDLQPVVDLFEQFDAAEMTFFARDGHIWRALTAVDEANQAILENLGRMAQVSAIAGGEANLHDQPDSAVVLLPLEPAIPHIRGRFNDLERPVRYGLPPFAYNGGSSGPTDDADDNDTSGLPVSAVTLSTDTAENVPEDEWYHNRGPWDVIFGWRHVIREQTSPGTRGTFIPSGPAGPGPRPRPGGSGKPPLSRGSGGGGGPSKPSGRWVGGTPPTYEDVAYTTWGPQKWLLDRVTHYAGHNLTFTRFGKLIREITRIKINFVWPREEREPRVFEPDWRIDFDEAAEIAEAGDPKIRETAFFVVEIKSKHPRGGAGFMRSGTWALDDKDNRGNPRLQILGGWVDPRAWEGMFADDPDSRVVKLNDHVWEGDWKLWTLGDSSIGLPPKYELIDGHRVPVWQPFYRFDFFVFAGVNVGPKADVRNPYEGFDPESEEAPAPTDLDHSLVRRSNDDDRFRYLSFLSAARRHDQPLAWPTRFAGGRPDPNMVAIAQAKVFNNHSWDLWTQMWQAELEPVTRYDDWMDRFTDGSPPPDVDADDLDKLRQYLGNARELALNMLGH